MTRGPERPTIPGAPAAMNDERWDTGIDYDRAAGRGGGFRSAVRRVFGDGENFASWGFPLFTAWGVRVRVHLTLLLFIAASLIQTLPQDHLGLRYVGPMMAILFLLVLLHEFGHCLACRWVGGEADEVMLWPLGGLATCRTPDHWKDDLVTTLGGPAVNALLLGPLALAVYLMSKDASAVFFNPFDPGAVLGGPVGAGVVSRIVWTAHYLNAVLLAFNMLLPMFPMDAGRVVHALLWRRMGRDPALYAVTTIGLVAAVALAFLAWVTNEITLVLIAGFGGLTCYAERKRLRLLATGWDGDAFAPAAHAVASRRSRLRSA